MHRLNTANRRASNLAGKEQDITGLTNNLDFCLVTLPIPLEIEHVAPAELWATEK